LQLYVHITRDILIDNVTVFPSFFVPLVVDLENENETNSCYLDSIKSTYFSI